MEREQAERIAWWDGQAVRLEAQLPKLCPECADSGVCQNRLNCRLICWCCGGQMGFGFPAAPDALVRIAVQE